MRHLWTTLVLILLFPVLPAMSGFSAGNLPTRADLSGSVADPQGAAVVDASVTLCALDRALVTATDQQGHYEFRDVLPGNYTRARAGSFHTMSCLSLAASRERLKRGE